MDKLLEYIKIALNVFANIQSLIFNILFFWSTFKIVILFHNKDRNQRYPETITLKFGLERLIIILLISSVFFLFTDVCLGANIFTWMLKKRLVGPIIFIIWIKLIIYMQHIHADLKFDDILIDIEKSNKTTASMKTEYKTLICNLNTSIRLLEKKQDSIKQLLPFSLLSLLCTSILNGGKIDINWDIYTIAIFLIIGVLVFLCYNTHKKIQVLMWNQAMVKERIYKLDVPPYPKYEICNKGENILLSDEDLC